MSEHYFSESPSGPSAEHLIEVKLAGEVIEVATDKGIFSPSRVDLGTAILIEHAPATEVADGATVVDLGCG